MTAAKPEKSTMKLYPLCDCLANANRLVAAGCTVHQQFNCGACGTKQTITTPNAFYPAGKCEECNHITNIEADGCNFLVIASTPHAQEALIKLATGDR